MINGTDLIDLKIKLNLKSWDFHLNPSTDCCCCSNLIKWCKISVQISINILNSHGITVKGNNLHGKNEMKSLYYSNYCCLLKNTIPINHQNHPRPQTLLSVYLSWENVQTVPFRALATEYLGFCRHKSRGITTVNSFQFICFICSWVYLHNYHENQRHQT